MMGLMESIWFKKPVDIETNVEFTERVLVIFFFCIYGKAKSLI
jgi:hypothetical protein